MKLLILFSRAALFALVSTQGAPHCGAADEQDAPRRVLGLDRGWRFLRGDVPGAQRPDFDDSSWQAVDLPHDWAIAGPFDPKNPAGGAGAFLPSGVSWYRRQFTRDARDAGRRLFVEFDGVMANSEVWINGVRLGNRPYGYVSFGYELTEHLRPGGAPNVLAVRTDTSAQPASRWYAGAGIFRHVRLLVENPIHLERWGTFVSTPLASAARAFAHIHATAVNQSGAAVPVTLRIMVTPPGGAGAAAPQRAGFAPETEVPAGGSTDFDADVEIPDPDRWDVDHPALYTALVQLESRGRALDGETVSFGVREARFEAATGFWLNGRNLKLKGVCVHADGGAFGAAVPLGVWERRLAALRQLGVNAIRTAHNPPDPGFLDLCDRRGFLVMDELFDCWTVAKNPYDYHLFFDAWSKADTRDTVRRDRNHPSIILWSAGNEIHDTPQAELSKRILAGLVEVFHANDPTRPVTQALFRPNVSHDYDDGLADMLDVVGTNYRDSELLAAHASRPGRRILGTENRQTLESWAAVRDNPPYSGQFLWVGIDYLGEARAWPAIGGGGDQSGLLDRTGSPKPAAFQRQSWWSDRPLVHLVRREAPDSAAPADPGYGSGTRPRSVLFSDWTPTRAGPHEEQVEVYSNAGTIELVLNGRSLGSRPNDPGGAPGIWRVPFEPGSLKAVATTGGRVVAVHELRTAGRPARIELRADLRSLAPGWEDVDYVSATVVDGDGVRVPGAAPLVSFHVDGPGAIAAVDSADNSSHEPFQATQRRAFQGQCFAILRATAPRGVITLTAEADDLAAGRIAIEAVPGPAARIPLDRP